MLSFGRSFVLGIGALVFVVACSGGDDGSSSSGGGGGAGGGSGGGGEGGGFYCTSDAQCAASDECKTVACVAGACVESQAPAGKPVLAGLVSGDCRRRQCAADGTIEEIVDDTDVPNDHNPCTTDACTAGTPSHTPDPAKEGASCGSGQVTCMGGVCVGCNNAGQCPTGGPCDKSTCTGGVCAIEPDVGKEVSNVDPTDCYRAVCDMSGLIVPVPAPNDVPVADANECDVEACSDTGAVAHIPGPDGVACGGSTECSPRACMAGMCTVLPMPGQETAVSMQVAGDCHVIVCDGMGGTVVLVDDTDIPADANTNDCVQPACTNGMPTTKPAPQGKPCSPGTLLVCNATGTCT